MYMYFSNYNKDFATADLFSNLMQDFMTSADSLWQVSWSCLKRRRWNALFYRK